MILSDLFIRVGIYIVGMIRRSMMWITYGVLLIAIIIVGIIII